MKSLRVQSEFWKDIQNQKDFFSWLGKRLGYKELDDWYSVTGEDIHKNGGKGLLSSYYGGSPIKALRSVYP